jgi:FixJ family two-component response regulator
MLALEALARRGVGFGLSGSLRQQAQRLFGGGGHGFFDPCLASEFSVAGNASAAVGQTMNRTIKPPVNCASSGPTVFVVDDEAPVLKSLSRLLRANGLAAAAFSSPREFLDRHDPNAAGCLVLDVTMPELNGLEVQQTLATRGHERPIVFLTGRGDIPMTVQAMKSGAMDFLTKPVNDADLLKAVYTAIEKDRLARRARAELDDIQQRVATLTPREREVVAHVVSGQSNKQIAGDLGTLEKIIKVHRARVMVKMKVHSVAELVRLAERVGVGGM